MQNIYQNIYAETLKYFFVIPNIAPRFLLTSLLHPFYMKRFWFLLSGTIVMAACSSVYIPVKVQHRDYRMYNLRIDSSVHQWLQPYRDSLAGTMGQYVITLANDLEKQQPEGKLGNLMADAMLEMAAVKYGRRPDAAFMNYGGIRLQTLKAGPITIGTIYELFPFDNILVLLRMKGNVLQQFLDHTAARGGWPVAGMTMQIQNKKAVQVLIGGKPLDPAAEYTIAIGDYTANGGDDAAMLVGIPQENNGYLMRDAIIDFLKLKAKEGKPLSYLPEKRVLYVQ